MALTKSDIDDLKYAMSILTRAELEMLCLDRAIRLDIVDISNEKQIQFIEALQDVPLSDEDKDEINRVLDIVTPYLDLTE
jgi:hypothetical protein